MNKYEKATMFLNSIGCEALKEDGKVSVLLQNPNARYWVYIAESEVDFYSNRYDETHGGYAVLKEVVAWADKQRESDIISLSLEELITEYRYQQTLEQ